MAAEITLAIMPPRKKVLNEKGEKFCEGHQQWLHLDAYKKRGGKLCDECEYKRQNERNRLKKIEREKWSII